MNASRPLLRGDLPPKSAAFQSADDMAISGPPKLPEYTKAELATLTVQAGRFAICTDATGGWDWVRSNGAAWIANRTGQPVA